MRILGFGSYFIICIFALNLMLWITLRIEIVIADGGGVVNLYGFPAPWFRTSEMGTDGLKISVLLFLVNFIFYFTVSRELFLRIRLDGGRQYIIGGLCVIALFPVGGALLASFMLDDWSSLVWLPWDGWDGSAPRISIAHGLMHFTSE